MCLIHAISRTQADGPYAMHLRLFRCEMLRRLGAFAVGSFVLCIMNSEYVAGFCTVLVFELMYATCGLCLTTAGYPTYRLQVGQYLGRYMYTVYPTKHKTQWPDLRLLFCATTCTSCVSILTHLAHQFTTNESANKYALFTFPLALRPVNCTRPRYLILYHPSVTTPCPTRLRLSPRWPI